MRDRRRCGLHSLAWDLSYRYGASLASEYSLPPFLLSREVILGIRPALSSSYSTEHSRQVYKGNIRLVASAKEKQAAKPFTT